MLKNNRIVLKSSFIQFLKINYFIHLKERKMNTGEKIVRNKNVFSHVVINFSPVTISNCKILMCIVLILFQHQAFSMTCITFSDKIVRCHHVYKSTYSLSMYGSMDCLTKDIFHSISFSRGKQNTMHMRLIFLQPVYLLKWGGESKICVISSKITCKLQFYHNSLFCKNF